METTAFYKGIPMIRHELLKMNTLMLMYKYEGKSQDEIMQMKKDRNLEDIDKILYNCSLDSEKEFIKKLNLNNSLT